MKEGLVKGFIQQRLVVRNLKFKQPENFPIKNKDKNLEKKNHEMILVKMRYLNIFKNENAF